MECSTCKAVVPDGSKFCIECGASLPVACPSCNHSNPPHAKFCGKCGNQMNAGTSGASVEISPTPPQATVPSTFSAERRQVTVMFSDLVGSTVLATQLDPEDLHDVINAYHRCVAEAVSGLGGYVAKYMGDGVLIYFGYPQAHEDDAERAVRSGLALVEAVGQLQAPGRLQVRIGIATGLVVIGDLIGAGEVQERGIVGETPNLAARLQALAEPDAVVIGPQTRLLLGNLFEYRDLGKVQVKGFAQPVHAYRVVGLSAVDSRFEALHATDLTPLVGRDEEMELLLRRWERAKGGSGQVVLISGEAGIGKSRVAAALLGRIGKEPHTRLRYFCSPHHTDSAFYPLIHQLERAAAFQRDDDARTRAEKLDALLSRAMTAAEDNRLIADLLLLPDIRGHPELRLSPPQRKQKTIDALLRQLNGLSKQQPVLQIFEDMHWSDPTSLEVMDRTVELVRRLPVLLLMTFRPEFDPPWVGQPHVTMMALGRLDQNNVSALIETIVGNGEMPSEIVNEIAERTDGVPLFVEELTKAVVEAGVHGPEAASTLSSTPSHTIPATLHASLMARLDRLGPAKELAQIGATIGREFSYELLAAVSSLKEPELRAGVSQLTATGLVFSRGTAPEASYLFKHALVQDAAYGTLLRRTRQQFHARIAKVLEERFPDRVAREPEVLGHHFSEAEQPNRAADYWLKAGRQSAERSANLEAIRHLSRALESLKMLPESPERDRQELNVQSTIGTPLIAVYGYAAPETGVAFSRARLLGERLRDAGALFATLSGQWAFHGVRGDHHMMRQLADEARRTSKQMADEALELVSYRLAGLNAMHFGAFDEARSAFETILQIYDSNRHRPPPVHYIHDPKFYAIAYLPVIYWILGYPEQARTWQGKAFEYAADLNQATLNTHVKIYSGAGLDELLFDSGAVRAHADAIIELADQHNLRYFRFSGLILRGWAIAEAGAGEEGLALMHQNSKERLSIGVSWWQNRYLCMLAATSLKQGRTEEGLAALAEARDLATRIDEHTWEAELRRIEGQLRRMQGASPAEVEGHFQAALAIARDQNAKSFELRAAISLARLWHEVGRFTDTHRDLLAGIYSWFTEGFDTPDLKEAKRLLTKSSCDRPC
ncbi:Predicted ATPase [Bradyrhizobium sp. Rc2d]|nr:Predicted ATPase [Bradyrhizobium sp. Rc2d]